MSRGSVIALMIIVGALCVTGAFAQQSASGFQPEGTPCYCVSEEGTNLDVCVNDQLCASAVRCATSADCGAGEVCWRGDNCCGFAICTVECTGGEACAAPAGTCGTYELCVAGVPTLGQWGLVTLAGLIGLIALTVVWRKNRIWTATSFVLLTFAVSLGVYSVRSIRNTVNSCQPSTESELAAALFLGE